jgi:integrase
MIHNPSMIHLVEEYLSHRRKFGFRLQREGEKLLDFARYADQIGHHGPITGELVVQWAKLPKEAAHNYLVRRFDLVRRFAKYRAAFDPDTEIPAKGLVGPSYRRPMPYIYSDEEISRLLKAASELPPKKGLRPHTYVTLFGLLASTGLRISEALALRRDDVDLKGGILTIKKTKFKKSRIVPVHSSTADYLQSYAKRQIRFLPFSGSNAFFLTDNGTPLNYKTCSSTFLWLRKKLGWPTARDLNGPRLHHLRHSFAVRRLIRWYQEGVCLDRKMIALATYLGHVNIANTYWYLTAVPELMNVGGSRFEHFSQEGFGGES